MDRYTKTVLTVIAGCLLVLVGSQVDFPSKAYAETGAAGTNMANGVLVGVTAQGSVYFYERGESVIHCNLGRCARVYQD
jgi:hypothetical protein